MDKSFNNLNLEERKNNNFLLNSNNPSNSFGKNNKTELLNKKRKLSVELSELQNKQKEILKRLAEQEEYLDYLVVQVKKIKKFIFWTYVGEIIKFLLVIVPIILAFFALKPMILKAWDAWMNLNNSLHSINSNNNAIDFNAIKDLLK